MAVAGASGAVNASVRQLHQEMSRVAERALQPWQPQALTRLVQHACHHATATAGRCACARWPQTHRCPAEQWPPGVHWQPW
jgi:hypothetical protein